MAKYCYALLIFIFLFETTVKANIVKTDKPYSEVQLEQDLKKIQRKYDNQIEMKTIGTTHFGKPIWAVKLGKGEQNIVLIGSHHGREWLTSMLLMKMLETYAEAHQQNKKIGPKNTSILNDVSIWFVPMLNPDGVAIQQNNLTNFPIELKKRLLIMNEGLDNFERWKANGLGIDLNRQYPAGWKALNQEPNQPYYQFYKGKKPFEAKEVMALTQFIKEIDPSIAVAYHTAGREIFWNYKNGKHLRRDYKVAKKIAKLTGYKLAKPDPDAVGGGFTDWFITTYRRPALTIELSYLVGETSPPLTVFKKEWTRNQYVGLKLAEEAQKLAE